MPVKLTLHGARGSIEAGPGDEFGWHDGTRWRIHHFVGGSIYSPSGLGGTPIVACEPLFPVEQHPHWSRWVEDDRIVHWCGDSIASAMLLQAGRAALEKHEP